MYRGSFSANWNQIIWRRSDKFRRTVYDCTVLLQGGETDAPLDNQRGRKVRRTNMPTRNKLKAPFTLCAESRPDKQRKCEIGVFLYMSIMVVHQTFSNGIKPEFRDLPWWPEISFPDFHFPCSRKFLRTGSLCSEADQANHTSRQRMTTPCTGANGFATHARKSPPFWLAPSSTLDLRFCRKIWT